MRQFLLVLVAFLCLIGGADAEQKCMAESCSDGYCEERSCAVFEPGEKMDIDGTRGYFISCPRCKLNYLHEVRAFLSEKQEWNKYKDLDMKWHNGHNPDLVLTDDKGREKERIDLSAYNFDGIHELLTQKGFMRK